VKSLKRPSLRTRLLLIVLVVNLVATAGSTAYFYSAQKRDLLEGIDAVLLTTAYGVMRIADLSYHDRVQGPGSITDEEYRRVMDRLSDFAKQTSARWVYSYMQHGGDFVYVSCSSPPEDLRNGTYARFFEKYETPSPPLRATMADGRTRWVEYDDPTGTYHSVFVRRLTSAGRPYVVGVDVPVSFVQQRLRGTALSSAAFGFASLLAVSLGLWVVVSRVVGPLRELTGHTSRLAKTDFHWDDEARRAIAGIAARAGGDEVGGLASVLAEMERQLRAYIVTLTETTAAKERIESELQVARDIQMGLLPRLSDEIRVRPDFSLHAVMAPAKEVGGDLYDFFMLDDERLFFLIGDVSDKGVPAALFMAVTVTLFRAYALDSRARVDALVSRVNHALVNQNPWQLFVTAFAAVLDTRTGGITYCDAGHLPPFLLRADGRAEEHEKTGGLVLACDDGFDYGCGALTLGRGDSIVVCTDGVTEAMDEQRRQFGGAGMLEALRAGGAAGAPEQVTGRVMDRVRAHAGRAPQSDDIAILAIQYFGPRGRADG
jgi:phosphoserine phosphatase RsbU/P